MAYEGKDFGDVREAAFRATQASWRKNQHLLTEHFESLSAAEARYLGRHLIADISRGLETQDRSRIRGSLGLLITLMSGIRPGARSMLLVGAHASKQLPVESPIDRSTASVHSAAVLEARRRL
ncbi:MAG: hypothetical protein IPH50_15060 [Rhodanobacteraceae bacterium]|nr:hypothetical protein [Rhodanobacteraceae bacterium]